MAQHLKLKHRQVGFKADAIGDDGTFTGYGSVFGNVDSYGEIVAPGAFADSIKMIKASGDPLPMLWQHLSDQPIGGYDLLEEDDRGLKVSGWLMKDDIPLAAQAYALMKRRVIKGLSIGYYVRDSSYDETTGVVTLKTLDLIEISPVTFPANDQAQVEAVKSALAHGSMPTLPQFEEILRDAGFTKSQAVSIASHGFRQLLSQRDAEGDALASINALLEGI